MDQKQEYQQPMVEIVEFALDDGIASSADTGGGAIGTEGLFE